MMNGRGRLTTCSGGASMEFIRTALAVQVFRGRKNCDLGGSTRYVDQIYVVFQGLSRPFCEIFGRRGQSLLHMTRSIKSQAR